MLFRSQSNAEAYQKKLSALDAEYQNTVENAKQNTLLFADRFPFRYLTDDYGLNYYAAFSGCSAESEASFKTITFLSRKVDELGLNSVFTIEKSDDRIAQTVIENTKAKDQNILVLKTVSGMAMAVAAALDAMNWNEIVGCIAGDDTIMCAVRTVDDTILLMEKIKKLLEQ